jgi:DNA-binding NtrC family response regulator
MAETLYPTLPILLVDDEKQMLNSFRRTLNYGGSTNILQCNDPREVPDILRTQPIEAILLDLLMPHLSGEELMIRLAEKFPEIPVIIITGVREVETAVRCMKLNAYDYLVKPVEEDQLLQSVRQVLEYCEMKNEIFALRQNMLSDGLHHPDCFSKITTQNKKMFAIFRYIEAVAKSTQALLITGETGVGKEMIAEAIHRSSGRPGKFIKISIAGLESTIFSDTLFGHTRGAFTGAEVIRNGLVEEASNGTLFLDEIGDLAIDSQIKLLRLIQEKEYFPIGSDEPKKSHTRIVAATNQDLAKLVQEGKFRNDLFYRLKSHHVTVPPLRERLDDLPFLVENFFASAAEEFDHVQLSPSAELIHLFSYYDFPGNVRELKAIIYDAVAQHTSSRLNLNIFSQYIKPRTRTDSPPKMFFPDKCEYPAMKILPTLKEANSWLIAEALKRASGNKTVAAQLLGISRQTIINYLKE